jgi:hypothetical protein
MILIPIPRYHPKALRGYQADAKELDRAQILEGGNIASIY